MKNILMLCPPGFSPVRQYRGEGVMERLCRIDPEIQILYPQAQEPWLDAIRAHVVYAMRTIRDLDVHVAETAIRMGLPLWYDADDDYFNVSEDSPAYVGFQDPRVREVITWFIKNSDVMTVSTADLAEKYSKLRPEGSRPIDVVPNALDDYALDLSLPPEETSEKWMVWRGGATHQADLWDFAEQFWDFLERTPEEWKVLFQGYSPVFIRDGFAWRPKNFQGRVLMNRYIKNYYAFMHSLREKSRPWAQIVPLSDNSFNRSKSNIAALEAVYAGAIPVVPDWDEWQLPAVFKYSKVEEFSKLMQKATRVTASSRRDMWEMNSVWIRKNRALSVVNQKRVDILRDLLGSGTRLAPNGHV